MIEEKMDWHRKSLEPGNHLGGRCPLVMGSEQVSENKEWAVPAVMSCEDVCDLLYLLTCNELESPELDQVLAHLGTCPDCRRALGQHVKLSGVLVETLRKIPPQYYCKSS
jgi:hypothetical protein